MADPEEDAGDTHHMTLLLRDITNEWQTKLIVEMHAPLSGKKAEKDPEAKLFERFLAEVKQAVAAGLVPDKADIWINYFAFQIWFTIPLELIKLAADKGWKINIEAND